MKGIVMKHEILFALGFAAAVALLGLISAAAASQSRIAGVYGVLGAASVGSAVLISRD